MFKLNIMVYKLKTVNKPNIPFKLNILNKLNIMINKLNILNRPNTSTGSLRQQAQIFKLEFSSSMIKQAVKFISRDRSLVGKQLRRPCSD